MRKILIIGLMTAFSALLQISCSKSRLTSANSAAVISGKWNLISDSTFQGVGASNHPFNYIGQAGDYFDFRGDGNVYTKESSLFDTLSYDLISDTSIIIGSFGLIANGVPEVSQIITLTADDVIIYAPVDLTPGGEFGRTVRLHK